VPTGMPLLQALGTLEIDESFAKRNLVPGKKIRVGLGIPHRLARVAFSRGMDCSCIWRGHVYSSQRGTLLLCPSICDRDGRFSYRCVLHKRGKTKVALGRIS
jgi:hypothetical protein